MPSLGQETLDQLSIERMIFHIIDSDNDTPIFLDELEPGEYEEFFLARVKDTQAGGLYEFKETSSTREVLEHILIDKQSFVESSKRLANRFQEQLADKRLKSGVLLLFLLSAGEEKMFSIIKYDHEEVIRYDIEEGDDEAKHAILADVTNTFVKKKEAMQKSALIRFQNTENGNPEIHAIDRSYGAGKADIGRNYEIFLGAKRVLAHQALTKRLYDALTATGKKHYGDLPVNIARNIPSRAYSTLERQGSYNPDRPDILLNGVFEGLAPDHEIYNTFKRELEKQRIDHEPIAVDLTTVKRPRKKFIRTAENIRIIYDEDDQDRISRRNGTNGEQEIVIRTTGISQDGDYSSNNR